MLSLMTSLMMINYKNSYSKNKSFLFYVNIKKILFNFYKLWYTYTR